MPYPIGWLDTITHLINAKKNVARVSIPMLVSSGQGSTGVGMNMHNMENMAGRRDANSVDPMLEDTGIMCIESYQLGLLAATATATATTSAPFTRRGVIESITCRIFFSFRWSINRSEPAMWLVHQR